MKNPLDYFFALGNKATRGDPTRKALFDYSLYWILFLAFAYLGIQYFYNFFFNGAKFSQLAWGLVMVVICWFNYWGLVAFRSVYENMKRMQLVINQNVKPIDKIESKEEMLRGFK